MPLSRLTQTLPLDLAELISESEAAPVGAGLAAFLAGAGLEAGTGAAAGALAGVLMADLLAAGADPAEAPESADMSLFFLRFFFGAAVSVLALEAGSPAVADDFFFRLLFADPAAVVSAEAD